jgi:hypothetical protein
MYHLECLLTTKKYHIYRQNHLSYFSKSANVVTELPTPENGSPILILTDISRLLLI